MSLRVEGATEPLVGSEQPFQAALTDECSDLLARHGFSIGDSGATHHALLHYRTSRHDILDVQSTFMSSDYSAISAAGAGGVSTALGIGIASAIMKAASTSTVKAGTTMRSSAAYTHTLSLSIAEADEHVAWQGDAMWESATLNLESGAHSALRLIVSSLPRDPQVPVRIDEIKASHARAYYRLYCKDPWFACPALPYRICFETENGVTWRDKEGDDGDGPRHPRTAPAPSSGISDGYALAAYRDLVQSADIALPLGMDKSSWDDPLSPELWARAKLGGRYDLGPSHRPIAVLVTLAGIPGGSGYVVQSAHVASQAEYADFERAIGEWRTALTNYFDVTVHE